MPQSSAQLKNILRPPMYQSLAAVLLDEDFAGLKALRTQKVARNLDGIRLVADLHHVDIRMSTGEVLPNTNLVGTSRWNKNRISRCLKDCIRMYPMRCCQSG
jgi:hypothetical protein